jgi:hypothetical protein
MGTFYNRQDMTAPCSPVTVGDEFYFYGRRCVVVKLNQNSFDYHYMNPSYSNKNTKRMTFVYWQTNKTVKFNTIRIGDDVMPWNTPEMKAQRKLKRIQEDIKVFLKFG